MSRLVWVLASAIVLAGSSRAAGQPPPNYDFDWATIGAPGNGPWTGPDPIGLTNGRGRVDYTYRISKLEVTTAQWMEFLNTYSTLGGQWTWFADPIGWGAQPDPTYTGPGVRWRLRNLPGAERFPVDGISWREAAQYCNWLHNGKSPTTAALENGAYDTSTFSTNPNGTFNDQMTHNPEAKFWIPTLDEWVKAVHYDPDRYGSGLGGYWSNKNMSEALGTPGLPGAGTTNAGLQLPAFGEFEIPLGAYADQVSPWGLWDTSGGTKEYLEATFWPGFAYNRAMGGSWAGDPIWYLDDHVTGLSSTTPNSGTSGSGLRIASSVPAPSAFFLLGFSILWYARRPRPKEANRHALHPHHSCLHARQPKSAGTDIYDSGHAGHR